MYYHDDELGYLNILIMMMTIMNVYVDMSGYDYYFDDELGYFYYDYDDDG